MVTKREWLRQKLPLRSGSLSSLERIVYVPQIPDVHTPLQPKVQERAHVGGRPVAAAAGVEQNMPLPGGAGGQIIVQGFPLLVMNENCPLPRRLGGPGKGLDPLLVSRSAAKEYRPAVLPHFCGHELFHKRLPQLLAITVCRRLQILPHGFSPP